MVVAIILLVLIFFIMFKMNWEKYFERYMIEEKESGEKLEGNN
jgi:hypothetical protein